MTRSFIPLAIATSFLVACGAETEKADTRAPAQETLPLPTVAAAKPGGGASIFVVGVTRKGQITLNGEAVTINKMIAAVKAGDRGAVTLRGHRYARWMHVQWVMAALGAAGCKEVRCAVHTVKGSEGVVAVPVYPGHWEQRFGGIAPDDRAVPVRLHVVADESAHGTAAVYHLEGNNTFVTRDTKAVAQWSKAKVERRDRSKRAIGEISASGTVPYEAVAAAMAAMQAASVERFDVGLEGLHPWDRDRQTLPAPPSKKLIHRWFVTDLSIPTLVPLNLPVADMSQSDNDNDPNDRLILSLTATGKLIHKDREIRLAALAKTLASRANAYDKKMREYEKEGFEKTPDGRRWSKMFVLLRADQDAPAQHVRWIMAELLAQGFYKLQCAARREPSADRTQEALDRAWAGRETEWPPPTLDGKLQCFLPTTSETQESYIEVAIRSGPAMYTLGDQETSDLRVVRALILRATKARKGLRAVGLLRCGSGTSMRDVMAALNSFAKIGITKVDFADISQAPKATREASPIPLPPGER